MPMFRNLPASEGVIEKMQRRRGYPSDALSQLNGSALGRLGELVSVLKTENFK